MRDYTVGGPSSLTAAQNGLVDAQCFKPIIDRELMKQLMSRSNGWATAHIASWFAALGFFGWLAHRSWGSWWAVPAFAVYGVLYGSMSDSRWHETGHRTAFRTKWMNYVVYYIASFMIFREPETWRWSHARHHSDTIIVGRDAEIAFKRNIPFYKYILELVGITAVPNEFKQWLLNASGRITNNQKDFQPPETFKISVWASRGYLAVLLFTVVASFWLGSFEPLMFIGLPSFYGHWLVVTLGITQHAGLAEDVTDHRLNTRTIYMGPLTRWIYWNMNYHVEHHIYPSVPFHSLKKLHFAIKDQLPTPYPSLYRALREIVPTMRRQATDGKYFIKRDIPQSAS